MRETKRRMEGWREREKIEGGGKRESEPEQLSDMGAAHSPSCPETGSLNTH